MCLLPFSCNDVPCSCVGDVELWGWSVDDKGDEEVGGVALEVALRGQAFVDAEEFIVEVVPLFSRFLAS